MFPDYHLIVWLVGFTPVWAFLIWHVKLNGIRWFGLFTSILALTSIWLAFNPMRIAKVTSWFHYYTLFIAIYLLIFTYKIGFKHFNKAFAISIWTVFLASEWWEIPVFIYDYFGVLGGFYGAGISLDAQMWIVSHIHRIYVLASFFLFAKVTNFKFNKVNAALLLSSSVLTFSILSPLRFYFADANTLARIISLSLFGLMVYLGVETKDGVALVRSKSKSI